jgi:LPS sulfotransferase NodH
MSVAKGLLFVVVGAQRTGTNLLREILNTNPELAMLGEVFTPNPAPAHWGNFAGMLSPAELQLATASQANALLDRYFDFVEYRIRNHWQGGDKSRVRAFGIDVKYNQLRSVAPADWPGHSPPFFIEYLKTREAILVHTIRSNVIHCAISALIAEQRQLWHDYTGISIDRTYELDPAACLAHARAVVKDRAMFEAYSASAARMAECRYESLVEDLARADGRGAIVGGAGPLRNIANALGVDFHFRNEIGLRKAINVPYARLIANHAALVRAVNDSEFASFSGTLE